MSVTNDSQFERWFSEIYPLNQNDVVLKSTSYAAWKAGKDAGWQAARDWDAELKRQAKR